MRSQSILQGNRMTQPMHQQMQQKRAYYRWLFGYDGIHDSCKRNPRSLYVIQEISSTHFTLQVQ